MIRRLIADAGFAGAMFLIWGTTALVLWFLWRK